MSGKSSIVSMDYIDLNKKLQKKILRKIREEGEFIPEDWYEIFATNFEQRFDNKFSINTVDIFDGEVEIIGNVNLYHPKIVKMMPDKFDELEEDGWIFSVEDEFVNGEVSTGVELDIDAIRMVIEEEIFNGEMLEFEEEGIAVVETGIFRDSFKKALTKYKKYSANVERVLTKWIQSIDAADIFFQDTFEIEEEDFHIVSDNITNDVHDETVNFIVNDCFKNINLYMTKVYNQFKKEINDEYKNFVDTLEDEISLDTFDIVVDENNKQIDVVDF